MCFAINRLLDPKSGQMKMGVLRTVMRWREPDILDMSSTRSRDVALMHF